MDPAEHISAGGVSMTFCPCVGVGASTRYNFGSDISVSMTNGGFAS